MGSFIRTASLFAAIAFLLTATLPPAIAHAEDWGDLTGRFIYDGTAPAPTPLPVNKDVEVCGAPPQLVDETFVVGPKGELANVVVWVRTPKDIKVHPDYAKFKTEKAVIDNLHCRFDPHVVICRVGQPLEIKNSDPNPVAHNTFAQLVNNAAFNFQLPAGSSQDLKPLDQAESVPSPVVCNIHGWMKGFLVVPPTPYAAVSDKDGKFEIKNLPTGTQLEFQVWHEPAFVQKATINGKDAGWTKGRFKMTIKPGDNDLGDIKVSQ
jgi:hypothetical protein